MKSLNIINFREYAMEQLDPPTYEKLSVLINDFCKMRDAKNGKIYQPTNMNKKSNFRYTLYKDREFVGEFGNKEKLIIYIKDQYDYDMTYENLVSNCGRYARYIKSQREVFRNKSIKEFKGIEIHRQKK